MAERCGINATGYPTAVTEPTSNSARLAACPIDEGGTPVEKWTRWRRDFPPLNLDHCPALVVAAAHPDDETLGLGGTAALLRARGVTVQIVAVTDGEAAYPRRDADGRTDLAMMRREELAAAAARLGLPAPIFLGIPDGKVAGNEDRLAIEIEAILAESQPGAWCAANWRADGHPDHEATGRAAASAAANTLSAFIEYPIWMWHWAIPDDAAVPWHRARRVPVTQAEMSTKAEAMRCYASQLEAGDGAPLLTPEVVARQMAMGEIVFA
jgi:LmbE family N-acetylglucosaminyl deacetylase